MWYTNFLEVREVDEGEEEETEEEMREEHLLYVSWVANLAMEAQRRSNQRAISFQNRI